MRAGFKTIATAATVALATAFSAAGASAAVSLSGKGCELKASDCELLIENAVMYNAVYDGTTTMYAWPQKSIRYRLARWLNAYVQRLDSCETPKTRVRPIISNVESFENKYDILAAYGAAPGSVCYIRKSRG